MGRTDRRAPLPRGALSPRGTWLPRAGLACAFATLLAPIVPGAAPAARAEDASTTPSPAGATACTLLLTGRDDAGKIVLQTVAYALDRPGLALAPPGAADRLSRCHSLAVRPDTGDDRTDLTEPLEVTAAVPGGPTGDLLVLHVPRLGACRPLETDRGTGAAGPDHAGDDALVLEAGARLIGLRERDGYRPRVFPASVDRRVRVPGGPDLLVVGLPGGGGAREGFLLDARYRLVATILPPSPGTDPDRACAVPIAPGEPLGADGPPRGGPHRPEREDAGDDRPIDLLARALLLTRDDQAPEAIALLDRVARSGGAFPDLLLERGKRSYLVGRTASAIRDFAAAARTEPSLHLAHFNLGVALGSDGRYREAAEAFSFALRLRPDHTRTMFHLALALKAAGLADRARGELDRLSGLDPILADQLKPLLGL